MSDSKKLEGDIMGEDAVVDVSGCWLLYPDGTSYLAIVPGIAPRRVRMHNLVDKSQPPVLFHRGEDGRYRPR